MRDEPNVELRRAHVHSPATIKGADS